MRKLHMLFMAMLWSALIHADNSITEYDKQFFIDTYASVAIAEMDFSGIPASITLAQAILESGWGRGTVAEGANNYFCIKCNNGWDGATFAAKDDEPGLSCFRKYTTVHQSFRDHSQFLLEGQRYQPLFQLEKTDFRGWAEGLKKCGYATDKAYAVKLIELIEEHGLWIFDYAVSTQAFAVIDTPEMPTEMPTQTATIEESVEASSTDIFTQEPMAAEETAAPFLAVPLYDLDQNNVETAMPQKADDSPLRSQGARKMRIRPITPHPVINLERAD